MDPQATWDNMLDAITNHEWSAAKESAENLAEWLRRDGFPPLVLSSIPPGDVLHRVIALAVCDHVMQSNDSAHT